MFVRMSGRCVAHWITTIPHYVEVETPKKLGHSGSSNATESKIVHGSQIEGIID